MGKVSSVETAGEKAYRRMRSDIIFGRLAPSQKLRLEALKDAYGISIRQEIERRTGRDVAIGAVDETLDRLEQKSLVRFTVAKAQPGQSGRPRKCFTATAAGERALAHTTDMLARMMRGWRPQTHPR